MYKASLHQARRYWLALMLSASGLLAANHAAAQEHDLVGAAQVEVQQVQVAIQKTNGKAKWTAGPTSMNAMSHAERMLRLGVQLPTAQQKSVRASYPAALAGAAPLPAAYDWRNVNGHSFVTSVKNQGGCGSCWAFATVAALESKALISMNTPDVNLNLSEQTMVSCSGAGSCSGGYVHRAAAFLVGTGNPDEASFAYTGQNTSCTNAAANWKNNAYKISSWALVANWNSAVTPDMIKNALVNSGPLPVTFNVNSDFFSYRSGVYSSVGSPYQGRHAVLIVGYDDVAKAFIVKNSWGTGWGENGYFRIAYDQLYGKGSTVEFGQEVLSYGAAITPGTVCLYSLSQNSQTVAAAGQTGSVNVTVPNTATCNWSAVSSASWITITGGASGSGSGKVSYSVAANTEAATRTGTIKIGDQTFSVTQAAANNAVPACTLSTSSTSIAPGGSAVLMARCTPAATSYTWSGSGFATSVYIGKVSPRSTATYSVKGNNAYGTGNTASVTVAVSSPTAPPSCTLTASASSVRAGDPVVLKASCSPAATSYTWTNTGFAANVAGGNVAPGATTMYSVSGNNAIGRGNVVSVTVNVSNLATPVCSLSASPSTINAGTTSALKASCIPAATSYKWTNTGLAATAAGGNVAPTTSTTYTVSGINAGGTGDAATATVTVSNSKPLTPSELMAPAVTATSTQPAFSWNAAAGATRYHVYMVNKSTGKQVLFSGYDASSIGCGSNSGTCSVKPAIVLVNGNTYGWQVLSQNSAGYSPWSREKAFKVVVSGTFQAGSYNAGPLYTNSGAQAACPKVCTAKGLTWGGTWWTTVPGVSSVCGCK